MQPHETMNVAAAVALLHAESETVLQFARRGELSGTRIGKSWVFLREDVIAFLKNHIDQETEERRRQQATAGPTAVLMPVNARSTRRTALPVAPKYRARENFLRRRAWWEFDSWVSIVEFEQVPA